MTVFQSIIMKFFVHCIFNPHLHEGVSEHRDQKYFGEVSFWSAEYRNRPPIVPLIFNFKNFGEFQKFLIRPEMHYLDAIFCLMQLKQYWNKIKLLINIYLLSGGNRHRKRRFRAKFFFWAIQWSESEFQKPSFRSQWPNLNNKTFILKQDIILLEKSH